MRIFSGIRPTGELHIGNYLGAIKQWVKMQNEQGKNDCVFCIVDLHAITTPFKPKELQENILSTAATYLASGIDPEKSILFVQSKIKEHTELAWLLGTITPLGELNRMTQFKEKTKSHPEYINAGLLSYPLLMASDILLYQTEAVPVGEDQRQHVELTREIARRFNNTFGETFKIPETILPKEGARIMSLQHPEKKMSKTEGNKMGYIELFERPENIKKKIMASVTDTDKEIKYNLKKKPGISNLLTIYSSFSGETIKETEDKFKNKGYAEFKKSLADLLIKKLEIFRKKRKELSQRKDYLEEILKKGERKAHSIADLTMEEVKRKMGLI
jgi:tryptophanyl-tRNA synthetase